MKVDSVLDVCSSTGGLSSGSSALSNGTPKVGKISPSSAQCLFNEVFQAPKCLQFGHQKQDALGSRQRKRDGLGGEDPSVVCAARTKVAPKEVQASNRGQFFCFKIQVACLRLTVINWCG